MSRFDERWKRLAAGARRAHARPLPPPPAVDHLLAGRSQPHGWDGDWQRLAAAARRAPEHPLPAIPDFARLTAPRPAIVPFPLSERWSRHLLAGAAAAAVVAALGFAASGLDAQSVRDLARLEPGALASMVPSLPHVDIPAAPMLPAAPRLPAPPVLPGLGALISP